MTCNTPRPRAWAGLALAGAVLASLLTPSAFAQATAEPATLHLSLPATASLGQRVPLYVHLANSAGAPIARADVSFISSASFLGATGEVVIARATTDRLGQATAEYEVRDSGRLEIRAETAGNERYAPSSAHGTLVVQETARQLYVEHMGVHIPGLNQPPVLGPTMVSEVLPFNGLSGMAALWPAFSGWPIALTLSVVWSLYGFVVVLLFRLAGAGRSKQGADSIAGVHAGDPGGAPNDAHPRQAPRG